MRMVRLQACCFAPPPPPGGSGPPPELALAMGKAVAAPANFMALKLVLIFSVFRRDTCATKWKGASAKTVVGNTNSGDLAHEDLIAGGG